MGGMMYHRILVPLENTATDAVILEHVRGLATFCKASVVLIHVADGFVARNYRPLALRESEEMRADREYLERCAQKLCDEGIDADSLLAGGDPAIEISAAAEREGCDLIAMSTHGHRFVKDILFGSVANEVRHRARVPVLCVRVGSVTPTPPVGVPAYRP
ncbi:MAG TPA: universal stress protein [Gemmatimonadaceae bacterium]|nr:universal stress protein [Gemmatimonadaceae bacterium]